MNKRLNNLAKCFDASSIDALLISKDVDIQYLTGFPASESWLLVSQRSAKYITDFRYVEEAKKGLKGIAVCRYDKSFFETLFKTAKTLKIKRLGLDDKHITLQFYNQLRKHAPKGIKLVIVNNLVENFRIIKEKEEVFKIKKALTINLSAYDFIKPKIKPGITESALFMALERYVKAKGVGFSFDPIVASGPNSSFPHAKVTARKILKNDVVLVDMGIDVEGYKSDLTRMFFLGKIPQLVKEVNDKVAAAQQRAIAKITDGVTAGEVDEQARNYLAKFKLAKYFGHSLGHGVGLEIHESPRISHINKTILKENMVFTVEPAVYIPNQFGIRIEDMVRVKGQGCEVLSRS